MTTKTGIRNRVSMAASRRPIRSAAAGRHGLVHGHGHGARVGARQQERKEKLVPGEDETEDEGRGKTRDDLRQADLEEDLDLGRPVDTGRILDVRRKLIKEAFHHPDGEGEIESGIEQDDAGIGAGKADGTEHQDHRNDDDDRGQHAGRQDDEEIGVVAFERIAREAIGRQACRSQAQAGRRRTRSRSS